MSFFIEKMTGLLTISMQLTVQSTAHKPPVMIHLQTSSSRLRKTGLMRPLMAVAATASALMTSQGAVIYSNGANISTISTGGTSSSPNNAALNVDGEFVPEFSLSSYFSKLSFHYLNTFSTDFDFVSSVDSTSATMAKLGSSISVDSNSMFSSAVAANIAPGAVWTSDSTGYFGFQFNPSGSKNLYGWGQLSISSDRKTMTLVDYAYENSGASILTAAVPEPSVSLLGLMGLTSVCFLRSRKNREVAG